MPSSCKDIRQELIDCLLKSKCVLEQRNTVKGKGGSKESKSLVHVQYVDMYVYICM